MPPTAPDIPAKPMTDPTAWRGNISDASVSTFADHPWCADAARPTSNTATHSLFAPAANAIGVTASAHASMAVLRAAFVVQPRFNSDEDNQPPPTLPMSAIR